MHIEHYALLSSSKTNKVITCGTKIFAKIIDVYRKIAISFWSGRIDICRGTGFNYLVSNQELANLEFFKPEFSNSMLVNVCRFVMIGVKQ